ncbi:MAG: hypothetical protein WCV73_01150 [Patescibacteria group bacterium]
MKKETQKIYTAKLSLHRQSRIVGWPKAYHAKEKKGFWYSIRSMLF